MENEKVSERNRPYENTATAKRFSSTLSILISIARLLGFIRWRGFCRLSKHLSRILNIAYRRKRPTGWSAFSQYG